MIYECFSHITFIPGRSRVWQGVHDDPGLRAPGNIGSSKIVSRPSVKIVFFITKAAVESIHAETVLFRGICTIVRLWSQLISQVEQSDYIY